ncbi:MAG: acetyl/propionyl/methylcrotonyl-CoA carboxylase subunit alpha [Pseudomonadales bacterium]|nr:acetyl/propionyl/methylcrotonyl-CoA carboxylase subunit alpha [Pseudomonadales bacterium]
MFDKILIANRGEIACRIIRTAQKLGIRTVAVYSEADSQALHVNMADEAVLIGAAPSKESYLLADRVIEAAKKTGAQAIHPGYGFLSENAAFSEACKDNDIVFIGPPVGAIESMGSKSAAKRIMEKAGVPLVPGYHGDDQTPAVLKKHADEMGYPVLLKATAGGGGKGMRQVWSSEEFDEALEAAKRESLSSFGDDRMLVEKYLTQPRHVEIQVFFDQSGNGVYLFERDCSVQRRHQKVIEEAPAPGMNPAVRTDMGDAALLAAKAIQYEGAGTVEFLLDKDDTFYFMEMNTRLQVEHPVTEMITGQDLVEWQLRVAAGEDLPLTQDQLKINGHSFEARIYAEDPDNDFLPVTGTLSYLQVPTENAHVRVDTGVLQGDEVSVFYDPMIAKLIVWDENRDRALSRMATALSEYRINGMITNIDFLYNLVTTEPFRKADLDTGFIEKNRALIFHKSEADVLHYAPLATLYLILKRKHDIATLAAASSEPNSPWYAGNGWRSGAANSYDFPLLINGTEINVLAEEVSTELFEITIPSTETTLSTQVSGTLDGNELRANIDGHRIRANAVIHDDVYSLFTQDAVVQFSIIEPDYGNQDDEASGGFTAPMTGTIVALPVEAGSAVKKNQAIVIMEAMKMEHTIRAPADGTVVEFYFHPGDLVEGGAELVDFEADESE